MASFLNRWICSGSSSMASVLEGHRVVLWLSSAMSLVRSLARGAPFGAETAAVAALAKFRGMPETARAGMRLRLGLGSLH